MFHRSSNVVHTSYERKPRYAQVPCLVDDGTGRSVVQLKSEKDFKLDEEVTADFYRVRTLLKNGVALKPVAGVMHADPLAVAEHYQNASEVIDTNLVSSSSTEETKTE